MKMKSYRCGNGQHADADEDPCDDLRCECMCHDDDYDDRDDER